MRAPRPMPPVVVATAMSVVTLLAGCSASDPAPAAGSTVSQNGGLPSAHVHALAIDPHDGALLLATHEGLVEVGEDARPTAVGPVIDLMGFTLTGPDHYLASGHPGLRTDLPNPVGLIETTDGGETWTPLSRAGESDFHALTALGDGGVLGYDGALRRSSDNRTWEQLDIPVEPHTIAAAPDGSSVLATTSEGVLRSPDGGATWAPVDGAPPLRVVTWADGGTAAGVDTAGTVWTSSDAAGTWQRAADLGAAPHAVAAVPVNGAVRIAVVTDAGLAESLDSGVTFTTLLTS